MNDHTSTDCNYLEFIKRSMDDCIQKAIEEIVDILSMDNMRSGWSIPRTIGKPIKGVRTKRTMRIRNFCKS